MAEKKTAQQKVKEITDSLEAGIKDLFTSEKFTEYLKTMSQFHRYSERNIRLIHSQMPKATRVAGFRTWKEKFERNVIKGEKGIKILCPTPLTIKKEMQKLDPDSKTPIIGEDGLPVTEEVKIQIPRFKIVHVFDVSQTDGKPLPTLSEDIPGDVRQYDLFMDTLRAVSPLPISFKNFPDNLDGKCAFGEGIYIREGMSEVQTICAVIHEITHAKLHDALLNEDLGEGEKPKSSATKEVESEGVSYAVCQYYGMETSPNSFGYIASWSSSLELKELKDSLNTIRNTAAELIDSIDGKFRELAKEQGIDLMSDVEQEAPVSEPDMSDAPNKTPEIQQEQTSDIAVKAPQETHEFDTTTEEDKIQVPENEDLEILPDQRIGVSERDLFGYTAIDILPLTADRAQELFEQDLTVYLLYPDNTEAMAFDSDDIGTHDGIFGIEEAEWKESAEYKRLEAQHSDAVREAEFLEGVEDAYAIYQVSDVANTIYAFRSFEEAGDKVSRGDYKLMYTAPLEPDTSLEALFLRHNLATRPDGDKMRSMSVSDVIVIRRGGEINSNYVDDIGFTPLPFLGIEGNRDVSQPEQTYSQVGNMSEPDNPTMPDGPSVAELEETVKSGGQISLLDLANAVKREKNQSADKRKPSIIAQLKENKKTAAMDADKTRASNRDIREV